MSRRFSFTLLAGMLLPGLALGDDTATHDDSSLADRVLTVTDVVLERHIDPPTRQQMLLAGVKALYLADEKLPPRGLSERVSALSSREQIAEYLTGVAAEFGDVAEREGILTRGMLTAVPGRCFLVDGEANRVQTQVLNNRYVGTGIALQMNEAEKFAQITKAFYEGPAWNAGIRAGDLIVEVDGDSMESKPLREVVELLRGESGSEVVFTVRRPDSDESRTMPVTRGRVFIPSVEGFREESEGQWKYTVDSAEDIALLRIRSIGPSTLHELRKVAGMLRNRGVRGVVVDLRTGGGLLHDTLVVADGLIDGGTIGHIRSWERSMTHEAQPGDVFNGLPMAVLVASDTGAGNVLLAAALQDNLRAVVVGEPTTMETYVASIVPIPGRDDHLRLPTAVMMRGDGTPLLSGRNPTLQFAPSEVSEASENKRPGFIMPDHVVRPAPSQGETPHESADDAVLTRAVEVLKASFADVSSSGSDSGSGS